MRRTLTVALTVALAAGRAASLGPSASPIAAPASRASFAAQGSATPANAALERQWTDAADAWTAGHYPEALRGLLALLKSPAGRDFHDRIAVLTGELFTTVEIAPDGRNPRLAPGGDYVTYEVGQPAGGGVRTRVVALRPSVRQIAELPGTGAAFDRTGGRLVLVAPLAPGQAESSRALHVRDLATGADTVISGPGLLKTSPVWSADGERVLFIGSEISDASRSDVYAARAGESPTRLTTAPGHKNNVIVDPSGRTLIYFSAPNSPFGGRGGGAASPPEAIVVDLKTGATRPIPGVLPGSLTIAMDGSMLAWLVRAADGSTTLNTSPPLGPSTTAVRVATGAQRLAAPALSPDGRQVAYQFSAGLGSSTDWEIYLSDASGTHRRVTREIQHDVLPRFLSSNMLLGLIGEPRHRRSHLYDLATGTRTRLFSNNTIRTISPEYAWIPSADGTRLLFQADRDGDTISPERGLYLMDLTRRVTPAELTARLERQLRHELDLRTRMAAAYRPLEEQIRRIVSRVSANRVYECQRAQASFDSKHVTQPGNAKAIEHLREMYASFGYTPEIQWMTLGGRGQTPPITTANVVSTLRGTVNPDLVYVASSHFDSVPGGPGADDDTSGTCALLEAARVLADTPLPATVVFASFTAEESGLLGSQEFVRLATERKWQVAGALNNDMIGWAGDGARLDNTVRYSNRGIGDLQLGASFLFSELVLYDARYYFGTDAASFIDAWGDVFAGIGSYPILANPNYHQPTDLLETINFRQVAETAKVTVASLVALASSPARVKGLKAVRTAGQVEMTWSPSPERDVTGYVVAHGPATNPLQTRVVSRNPRATLSAVPPGSHVAVRAVNARGLESWDWARAVVP
jgi:hypothetical protein